MRGRCFRGDHERDRVFLLGLQDDPGRLARTGQVTRPPARFGQVDETGGIEHAETGHRLELHPGEGECPEAQVRVGEHEFDGPHGSGFGPDEGRGRGHAGNRRCASSPRR